MTYRLTVLIPFAAVAALALASCADGINGHDGVTGTSCSAKTISDTTGATLGYSLTCSDSSNVTFMDTVWNGVDGVNGVNCSAKPMVNDGDTTGFALVCDGDTVGTIANGADGNDGADGKNCYAKALANGLGYTFTCGDSSFTVLKGVAGADGVSCAASDTTDNTRGLSGYKITCGDSVVGTIWNGAAGATGTAGADCSVSDTTDSRTNLQGYKIECDGKTTGVVWSGSAGATGAAGTSCTMTAIGDSIVQVCGSDSVITYKAWCGATPYDPAVKFCSMSTLYEYCNGKTYDPLNQFCFGSVMYAICDGQQYDPTKQYCYVSTQGDSSLQALLTDSRDGQTYKTVTVGDTAVWMAQNLNYNVDSSFCYDKDTANCTKYGRLYTWVQAMSIGSEYLTTQYNTEAGATYQGICPDGWRLPTTAEWSAFGRSNLKGTDGWNSGTGENVFGLNILPAGYAIGGLDDETGQTVWAFYRLSEYTAFWTSMESDANNVANIIEFSAESDVLQGPVDNDKSWLLSVRCIKGEATKKR